jgi:hypothetical protein
MSIVELHILPPFAIGRFGSSPTPLEAYELRLREDNPLGYRDICPMDTLMIDETMGTVAKSYVPDRIRFKDDQGRVHPVAPFLEVFASMSDGTLQPLTLELLEAEGLDAQSLHWSVTVANLKVFRQTGSEDDKVVASVGPFNTHEVQPLRGECKHFLDKKYIPFGTIRYIRPSKEFPEIRLRFTPAAGKVYGANKSRISQTTYKAEDDPVFKGPEDRIVYDTSVGQWRGFQSNAESKTLTNPSDIYEGFTPDPNKPAISWGYLDDVCDGPVSVDLVRKDGSTLSARAWISACMPAFAPDSLPIRTVADELEQLIHGPSVKDQTVSVEAAAEIVRRSLETVRHMNTLVMNGNVVDGRTNIAHTLGTQDTNDFGRLYAPIMASSLVDNLAVRALHERIYTALLSGTAPWFADVLRQPEEIGDLSDAGRRKMPAMLRGADSRALALTRRQISKITEAAISDAISTTGDKKTTEGGSRE